MTVELVMGRLGSAAKQLAKPYRSDSAQAARGFALGGVAFTLANLLLARYLTIHEYALFALRRRP